MERQKVKEKNAKMVERTKEKNVQNKLKIDIADYHSYSQTM